MNPTPRPNPVLLALLAAAFAPQAFADNPADTPADSQNSPQAAAEPAFTLGEITVRGRRDTAADESVVRAAGIRRSNSRDIAQALATQPSVSIDFSGGRNETGIRVRGFDARQVPLFLDGIPQYVPYDGYVDFARFPTPGLAEIRTAKAGASLMYGFNTMGGAINLVTRKPQKAFEGSAQVGLDDSSGRNVSLNLGSATERFYVQGGFAYLHQNRFRLPKDFSDLKARPTDTGRYRENAGHTDRHYSLKLGLTPNETDEYAEYRPSRHLTLAANARLESGRRSAYGSSTRKLGGYAVYDAKAVWNIRDGLSWEISLDNITDKKYELTDGHPMPGCSWYTNLCYTF